MLKSYMTLEKKNFEINSISIINFLFAFFPISFILGNFIINLNLILFCCLGIFHLKSKILKTKIDFIVRFIFIFFFVIFFSTILSFIISLYFEGYINVNLLKLVKSIVFFRFFLLLLIIYLLSKFDILNFKYFFLSATFFAILLSLDVIFQYIFGFDMIGLKSSGYFNSGFFGDELISGGFIQRFSFFSIFFLTFLFKNKNTVRFILTTSAICLLGVGIFLSGNRMPLILFLFGLFLIFLFNNKLRKIVPVSVLILFILFKFVISTDVLIKESYRSYYQNANQVMFSLRLALSGDKQKIGKNSTISKQEDQHITDNPIIDISTHRRLFLTALDTWKLNKIFGNGLKSFRIDCRKLISSEYNLSEDVLKFKKNRLCSNHPHNYYFEILTETGIIGMLFIVASALFFLVFIFKNLRFLKGNNIENFILLSAVISLIVEMFPIRSTGSFFTTNNITYIIIILSIIVSYKELLIGKNFR